MPKKHTITWDSWLNVQLSKQDVESFARELHHDEEGISQLVGTLLASTTNRVTVNAAWILSHLSPADKEIYLTPLYNKLVDFVLLSTQSSSRRLVLCTLFDMPVGEDFRTDLLDFCMNGMLNRKEIASARSVMVKLSAKMCKPYPELANELILHLELLAAEPTPSIACARKNVLRELNQSLRSAKR